MSSIFYRLSFLIFLITVWLVPLFWTGWTLQPLPFFPQWLATEHQVSGLFLRQLKSCYDFHVEWKTKEGQWFEVDERKLYPAVVFADRSRFDQLVSRSHQSKLKSQIQHKIVRHAFMHGKETRLVPAEVIGVRLVRTDWKVGEPELAFPKGGWKQPHSLGVPMNQRTVLAEYEINTGVVSPMKTLSETVVLKKSAPTVNTQKPIIPTSPPPERRLIPSTPLMPKGAPMNLPSTKSVD